VVTTRPAAAPGDHRARRRRGDPRPLWSGTADGTGSTIDLAPIAGKLVALSFTGPCTTRWIKAAIAVAARDVPAPAPPVKNVILVVTTRCAAIASRRWARPRRDPAVLRARRQGVAFRRHQSMAPSSPPSHAVDPDRPDPARPRRHRRRRPARPRRADDLARAPRRGLWTGYVGDNGIRDGPDEEDRLGAAYT